MKKAITIWIGLLFLMIDTRIPCGILYPEYIPFDTPAPQTVSMIIDHLIGKSVRLDLFSDLIGYVLILYVTNKIVNENDKAFKAFMLAALSLILYVANWGMPFVLNGEARYVTGFCLYLVYIFCKCLAAIQAGLVCCEMAECLENHAWNNVVAIFLILSCGAGFIRGLCFFYELNLTSAIYYAAQVFFAAVYTVMFWKRRKYWLPQEAQQEIAQDVEAGEVPRSVSEVRESMAKNRVENQSFQEKQEEQK